MDNVMLLSQSYANDNYLVAKKAEDGSYEVDSKIVFNNEITTPDGKFVTKKELDEKQDKLSGSETIDISNNTLTVNTASEVGDSTLPVTAAAVNTYTSTFLNKDEAASTYASKIELATKQDTLTAGEGIEISANNVISATGGGSSDELKYKTFLVMVANHGVIDYLPSRGDSANHLGYNIVVKDSYNDQLEDGWRMFKFDKSVTCSTAQQLVFEAGFNCAEEPLYRCIKESVYDDNGITQPFPFISSFIGLEQHEWYTVSNDMFTKVYGNPTTGDGTVSVGQNQTVLLPADKTHIRAVPGDKIGAGLLGMIIGVKPDAASPADEKSMIAAFTYFDGRACMYAHLNNGTTIPLSETSGNYVYSPGSGWSGNKNPFIDCLGGNTSTAPFELEKVDRYKIKVTNLAENRVEEIDVSSWPFFQEGGEIRFGFCGYNANNSGMTVNDIEYFD